MIDKATLDKCKCSKNGILLIFCIRVYTFLFINQQKSIFRTFEYFEILLF